MESYIDLMNKYGADKEPFLFIIDFEMKCPEIHKLSSIPSGIKFSTPLISDYDKDKVLKKKIILEKYPVSFERYSAAFAVVHKNLSLGNSYLINLTFPTLVETKMSLENIFYSSVAKYKLLYHNSFVVFSPEIFVRIQDGEIHSFPMKGTIDASVPDAEEILIGDIKEKAEHNTIVDLIRNDLSKVADNVIVNKYRYVDRIVSEVSELLQVSSEISGTLRNGYENMLGDIIAAMLPAGSVTGAPKPATVRIIRESENYDRGWYTGVFGVFDGKSLDSAVMIRYIEQENGKLYFKSGGGITYLSDPVKEYEELIAKVYVPAG